MAFNRAQFNLVPYNVQSSLVRYLTVSGYEEVDVAIGSALNLYPYAIGFERVEKNVEGTTGRFITAIGIETIDENVVEVQTTVVLFPHFEENVISNIKQSANVMLTAIGTEQIENNVTLGAIICPDVEAIEAVQISVESSAVIKPVVTGYELISVSASLDNIETKTCILTLTLKPGQVLIVDANNYNVLLDGQNAIDVQSGDWIDELNRNTTEITIAASAGTANLTGEILYTERYL